MLILADGVTITIGHNIWSFSLSFLLYLLLAAIVGVIAEYIVGWRVPLGIIGAIVAGIVGAWLMTQVVSIQGVGDLYLFGNKDYPLFRALLGAIVFVGLWHLLTYGMTRRYYREAA